MLTHTQLHLTGLPSFPPQTRNTHTQTNNTIQRYIDYRYGGEAAEAAAASVPVAHDMLRATLNTTRLGARAAVSKTAKRTTKMWLKSALAGVHPDDQAKLKAAGI